MHIIRFEAQNIQRLSAVTIEPSADASAVVLAGANEEGKSSVLDSIEMALGGEKVLPPEPIRRGQEKAQIVVDLGDMIVTRRFTAKGSSLTVTNREGLSYPSPQALLNGFYNKLSFDPLAFAHAKADEQGGILRRLAGLDTKDLDDARKKLFEARTIANRDVARAAGALATADHYPDVTDPQDAAALLAQLADADRLAKVVTEAERALSQAQAAKTAAADRVRRAGAAVDDARLALDRAEQELEAARVADAAADDAQVIRKNERDTVQRAVPDTAALREQLAGVQAHNRKVDANTRRATLAEELARYQAEAASLTTSIEDVDATKAKRLAGAKFPVEGLGISDAGVTWNGLPFEQASTAIRTRVSAAIGFALNPKLKILLVRNGNDLDEKNLKLLADAATEVGGQVWIERIAGGNGLQTVVIEDGAVKGAPAEPLDARAHASDGDTAAVEAGFDAVSDAAKLADANKRGPRRRAAAGLFEEGAAK
jgi:hypothetical protein